MKNKKILVTDDAAFMRSILKNILIPEQFSVIEASNGQEAVNRYRDDQPDLVFMDITMPVMDGITATRTIKEANPGARIVMCSALGQKETLLEAIRAGAEGYVLKPFKPESVLATVKKILG